MSKNRAIVLGASIAGLLAARALSDAYAEVVIVDRDTLTNEVNSVPRRGVPQGRHAHGLLGGGLRAIEELLPGATEDLLALGVPSGDILANMRYCANGGRLRQVNLGHRGLAPSRPMLESYLRSRVMALPGVSVVAHSDIISVETDAAHARVIGARIQRDSNYHDELLTADLVVDASGRGSRTPLWLNQWGYAKPVEERLKVDLTYTSRHYGLGPDSLDGDIAIITAPTVAHPRGGVIQVLEEGKAIVTLFGFMGDCAPEDAEGFLAFAKTLPMPFVHEAIQHATALDDAVVFRFPASVRRRYERLRTFPAGLLVIGDAVCSFNPLYGQGMSVSAMEAVVLRELLGTRLEARRFFRAIAPIVDVPWQIVVGGDLAFPQIPGEPTFPGKVINAYLGRLQIAARRDALLAAAFVRVSNLLARPPSLLRPDLAVRVLVRGRR